MTTATTILSILTLLLGGTNIVTLAQLRSLRRKAGYEADALKIANLQKIIDVLEGEVTRLAGRLEAQENKTEECGKRCEERIAALQDRYESIVKTLRASGVKLPH